MNEVADIMMVTYNRLDLTKLTLDNIFKTTHFPFRFIIIDNASSDNTVDYLKHYFSKSSNSNFKGYKLYTNVENKGISIGRNQALLLSDNEWLVTLDNDVNLPDNWLSNCVDILKANRKYGALGVNLENVSYPLVNLNGFEFEHKNQGNLGTACTVFNRKIHKMIGFFNTQYKIYAHEDADFFWRVKMLGLSIGYLKEHGLHLGEGSNDVGEYREMKNKYHAENLQLFYDNCRKYMKGEKPIMIPFSYNFEQDVQCG